MGSKSIKHSRAFGQNFFVNNNLAKKIVIKITETEPNTILEIGSGTGVFTKLFSGENINLICVEKDHHLAEKMQKDFSDINIVQGDVLDVDISKILEKDVQNISFGSLPYNQSKKIINKLIQFEEIHNHFYIIQKEVAEKYLGNQKSFKLSLSTQLYTKTKRIFDISPNNFKPKPKVTSTLVHFERHKKYDYVKNKGDFIKYLDTVFKQPRRKIKNNLKLNKLDGIPDARPEDLGLEEHLELWQKIKTK